jgi:hypothetical protein
MRHSDINLTMSRYTHIFRINKFVAHASHPRNRPNPTLRDKMTLEYLDRCYKELVYIAKGIGLLLDDSVKCAVPIPQRYKPLKNWDKPVVTAEDKKRSCTITGLSAKGKLVSGVTKLPITTIPLDNKKSGTFYTILCVSCFLCGYLPSNFFAAATAASTVTPNFS